MYVERGDDERLQVTTHFTYPSGLVTGGGNKSCLGGFGFTRLQACRVPFRVGKHVWVFDDNPERSKMADRQKWAKAKQSEETKKKRDGDLAGQKPGAISGRTELKGGTPHPQSIEICTCCREEPLLRRILLILAAPRTARCRCRFGGGDQHLIQSRSYPDYRCAGN